MVLNSSLTRAALVGITEGTNPDCKRWSGDWRIDPAHCALSGKSFNHRGHRGAQRKVRAAPEGAIEGVWCGTPEGVP